jgi:hypothetical protein
LDMNPQRPVVEELGEALHVPRVACPITLKLKRPGPSPAAPSDETAMPGSEQIRRAQGAARSPPSFSMSGCGVRQTRSRPASTPCR